MLNSITLIATCVAMIILTLPIIIILIILESKKNKTKEFFYIMGAISLILGLVYGTLSLGLNAKIQEIKNVTDCKINYIYNKFLEKNVNLECKELKETEKNDLSKFEEFLMVWSMITSTFLATIAFNLLYSAITYSNTKNTAASISVEIDSIKLLIQKQNKINLAIQIIIALLLALVIIFK